MPNQKNIKLEILISTMNKVSFDFLESMFPDDYESYNILIVNQTSKGRELKTSSNTIRVINSYEKGLPQSRNIAISNAIGDICLIADDDVTYLPNFHLNIINAFKKRKDADIITFKMHDERGKDFKNYTNIIKHDKKSIRTVNSVVIVFNRSKLLHKNVFFNNHFGLGATFESANEYVFLRNALSANLNIYFEPKTILVHDYMSSGREDGNDRIIFARSAVFYKYFGVFGYIKLLRYLYLIRKKKFIKSNEIISKLKVGLKGISTYRKLEKSGLK